MIEKGRISKGQFVKLSFLYMIGSSTLISTPIVIFQARQDAWLSVLIATIIALIIIYVYVSLAKRYPNKTIIEFSEEILGKWGGKFISSLYFIYFLFLTSGLTRVIGDLLTTKIMAETPIIAIEIAFILIVIYGVYLGLETFARTSEMVFPWVVMFFILSMVLLIPEIKIENLSPVLGDGLNPAMRGVYRLLGIPYLDMVIILMLAPYVVAPFKLGKALVHTIFLGGFVIISVMLLSITVLGPELTSHLNYPLYDLAQRIDIANFIQRIEVLSGGVVFIAMFMKIVICFYSLVLSLAQILELKQYTPLNFPIGIIVLFMATLLTPNIIFFEAFISYAWTPFTLIFGLLIPLLMLMVDKVKKRLLQVEKR